MEAAAAEPRKSNGKDLGQPVLMPDRFGEAEFKVKDFVVFAEAGTTVEQVLSPAYWSHVANQMEPFSRVMVCSEDGAWVAYLIVHYAERNYAKVALDRVVELEGKAEVPNAAQKHRVEWKGPHHKWAVIRNLDNQMLSRQHQSRVDAETWMRNHERGMEK